MEFLKLEPRHIKEVYDIRFSVKENMVHAHQIQYLQREQVIEDISQGVDGSAVLMTSLWVTDWVYTFPMPSLAACLSDRSITGEVLGVRYSKGSQTGSLAEVMTRLN